MARPNVSVVDETAPADGSPERRRRAPQGPRKEKPIYVLFRVTDETGAPVRNAKLEVEVASKDTNLILDRKTDDLSLTKIEVQKLAE
jgi:hypothetical protein